MANFTAADVKKLRDATGAGMMDAKKALVDNDGDFERAIETLRIKGAAKAAKRGAERTASNGLVAVQGSAMIELNCETDFVAKNADFQALAAQVVAAAADSGADDVESLKARSLSDGRTVGEAVEAASAVIGEKIELGKVAVLDGPVAVYLHKRSSDLPAQVGVLVAYTGDETAARGAAMQVAAMRPQYVSRDDVPDDVVAKEREIAEATARESGKPEQALPKIVDGRLAGFFKDVALLDQPSVQDAKKSVAAVLEQAGTAVTAFVRFEVGAP